MSTNKTENLNLHSWTLDDAFKMSEFNENFNKLDQNAGQTWDAIAAGPQIVTGTYAGNNASSRTISLGFRPKAVYVCRRDGLPGYTRDGSGIQHYGGLALDGKPALTNNGSYTVVEVAANGFTVYNDGAMTGTGGKGQYANYSGWTYYYVALK